MAATVPEQRIIASKDAAGNVRNTIAIANSVRAISWVDAARLQCWLAGRGSMDVPSHAPFCKLNEQTAEFRYWTKPRYQTTRYALTVLCSSASIGKYALVQFPTGATAQAITARRRRDATPVTLFADVSAQGTTEGEITLSIQAPSGTTDLMVDGIQIEALPRTILSVNANDLGANRLDFFPRQPILESNLIDQILDSQNNLRDAARRVGLYQMSRGTVNSQDTAWHITSGTYVDLHDGPVTFLPRKLYSGQATYNCSWRVLVKCSDGTTAGDVRVSNTSGGTGVSVITVPAGVTAWTWLPGLVNGTSPATFVADCEDNTTSDGRRSSRWDEHTFEARRTAGAGTMQIATISVYDAAA